MAAPLAKTNEIIIMSGDNSRVTGEVTRLLAELPVSVNALTGVDMMKVRPPPPYDGSYGRRHVFNLRFILLKGSQCNKT